MPEMQEEDSSQGKEIRPRALFFYPLVWYSNGMILFVLLMLSAVALILTAIWLIKKNKIRFWAYAILVSASIYASFSVISCLYHVYGNEMEYRKSQKEREEIIALVIEARAVTDEAQRKQDLDYAYYRVDRFNASLQRNADFANSPWVGCFHFRYALDHFDELFIWEIGQ